MTDKTQINLLNAILVAELTKAEIKLIIHLSTKYDKYFIINNTEITEKFLEHYKDDNKDKKKTVKNHTANIVKTIKIMFLQAELN